METIKTSFKIILQLAKRPSRSPIGMPAIRRHTSYSSPTPKSGHERSTQNPPGPSGNDQIGEFDLVSPDTQNNCPQGRKLQAMLRPRQTTTPEPKPDAGRDLGPGHQLGNKPGHSVQTERTEQSGISIGRIPGVGHFGIGQCTTVAFPKGGKSTVGKDISNGPKLKELSATRATQHSTNPQAKGHK